MSVHPEKVMGPGIANNSLGRATVAILPNILEKLGIELDANLLLLGSVQSLGRGNLHGLRFFLDNYQHKIDQAICVEGIHLGRLSYSSLGMFRAEVSARVPEETAWHHFGRISAARILNRILNRLYAIPIPREPKTSINIGTIQAGNTFSDMTTSGRIRFEIRSEDLEQVERIRQATEEIVEVTNLENNIEIRLEEVAERNPGGIPYSHPMVKSARHIMKGLEIEPQIAPSVGELSALIAKDIPALTLGLTVGENLNLEDEAILIERLYEGVAQLIAMIIAADRGLCDEEN
jgi:di/tripeptidase